MKTYGQWLPIRLRVLLSDPTLSYPTSSHLQLRVIERPLCVSHCTGHWECKDGGGSCYAQETPCSEDKCVYNQFYSVK